MMHAREIPSTILTPTAANTTTNLFTKFVFQIMPKLKSVEKRKEKVVRLDMGYRASTLFWVTNRHTDHVLIPGNMCLVIYVLQTNSANSCFGAFFPNVDRLSSGAGKYVLFMYKNKTKSHRQEDCTGSSLPSESGVPTVCTA